MPKKQSEVSQKNDWRLTRQRLEILEWVRKSHAHPTAEDIYQGVKKKLPKVSLGTVYRNLQFLAGHGLLKEFMLDKVSHFESRVDSHLHFVCENCHGIEDIDGAKDLSLIKELQYIAEKNKFYIRSENYEIRGICRRCRQSKTPRKLTPELFCIACGHLVDDLKKESAVCQECKFNADCHYLK